MSELLFIELRPLEGKRHPVEDGTTIGRGDADIVLADPEVSHTHAVVRVSGSDAQIEDLGSSNGTFVNDQRITAARSLRRGDVIRLGTTVWRFEGGLERQPRRREPAAVAAPSAAPSPGGPAEASHGDVPPPPDPAASSVRPTPPLQPSAPPEFPPARPGERRRRGSAARSGVATLICIVVIVATAIALAIYFGSRDEDGGGAERDNQPAAVAQRSDA